jgi:hypothetical protein
MFINNYKDQYSYTLKVKKLVRKQFGAAKEGGGQRINKN